MGPSVAKSAFRQAIMTSFFLPKGRLIDEREINRLTLAVESKKYSEIDLVVAHDVDPHGLLSDYLDRSFVRQKDETKEQVRIVRFLAPCASRMSIAANHRRNNLEAGVELRIKELLSSGALTFSERFKPVSSRPSSEYDVMIAGKIESRIFAIERAWFCKLCLSNTASTRMERTA